MTIQIPGPQHPLTMEQPGGGTSANNFWWDSLVTPGSNFEAPPGPKDAFWNLKTPGYGPDYVPSASQSS